MACRLAIIWTNAGIVLVWLLGTNFSEILIDIHTFSFKKMHLKISLAKWRQICIGCANPYSTLLHHWQWGNRTFAPMTVNYSWLIGYNRSVPRQTERTTREPGAPLIGIDCAPLLSANMSKLIAFTSSEATRYPNCVCRSLAIYTCNSLKGRAHPCKKHQRFANE